MRAKLLGVFPLRSVVSADLLLITGSANVVSTPEGSKYADSVPPDRLCVPLPGQQHHSVVIPPLQ